MKFFFKDRSAQSTAQAAPRGARLAAPALRRLRASLPPVRAAVRATPCAEPKPSDHELQTRLHIPINTATADQIESAKARDKGQFLARQERWEELDSLIRSHDQNRAATTSGTPLAELLILGARSDVVRAAEHALLHGEPAEEADFLHGIEALEWLLEDFAHSYPIALVVAHMHIDVGWAWRGALAREDSRKVNRDAFYAHFARASDILRRHCPKEHHSAALSAAYCALLPGDADPTRTICAEYERLISLDPRNPRHMRTLGTYLLPRWYGDLSQLDLQARRIAAQTYDTWGAGGYAWVWYDALLVDPSGLQAIEMAYFIDGVSDALTRKTDQHAANLFAAQLYHCWKYACDHTGNTTLTSALQAGFDMVVKEHLREIHPLIWGHAAIGFENTSRIISKERLAQKGCELAMKAVAMPFMQSLKAGQTVNFSPDGITQTAPSALP